MSHKGMRIGILTSGGDCPGLNAAIRGVGKTAILKYGMKVYGVSSGFQGLISREFVELDERKLSGILTVGGTILGTSREKPFKNMSDSKYASSKPELIKKNYEDKELDCIVCIGGNGTQKTAYKLAEYGLNIIGIPKTIDNDVWGTDLSFGFDSAVTIATDALDRLHTTANSHKRIMVMEVMGHHAGWLALYSGISGGGDVILIPEIAYDIKIIARYLERRASEGKPYSIVVVAEGIDFPKENLKNSNDECVIKASACNYIARQIESLTGLETRETILGYLQRGGSPSHQDRLLATRFGTYAAELIAGKKFGRMVSLKKGDITSLPLKETAGRIKLVPKNDSLIKEAKLIGTCFGDEL
jgi:ATP-dependent phosphofructokinase / diphosphate-dependent phosphofructokinase